MAERIEIVLEGLTNLDHRELVRTLGVENVQNAGTTTDSHGTLRDVSAAQAIVTVTIASLPLFAMYLASPRRHNRVRKTVTVVRDGATTTETLELDSSVNDGLTDKVINAIEKLFKKK
jgi:hypothetical protein